MTRGWIKLWRKFQDNPIWREHRVFSKAEAWIDILMEVQSDKEDREVIIGNKVFTQHQGESLHSLDSWARRWKWTKSKTRRVLLLFQRSNQIRLGNETQTIRLTVCNYDIYNDMRNESETEMKRKRNASETHSTPNKNDKNERIKEKKEMKKEKKTPQAAKSPYGEYGNVFLTSDEYEKLITTYGETQTAAYIERCDLYVGGNKAGKNYTSHYLTILSWMRKDGIPKLAKTPVESKPDNHEALNRRISYAKHLETSNAKLQTKFHDVVIEPLREELNAHTWKAFIEPLLVAKIESGVIWLYSESAQWLTENYKAAIESKLKASGAKVTAVEITDEIPETFNI